MPAQTNTTTEQLSRFFEGLDSELSSYRKIRKSFDKKIAFDFNSVNFFWPGENKVSEILAFFLDPYETHGQGDTFLLCFLEMLKLEHAIRAYDSSQSARIELEHRTDENRRIDITVCIGDNSYWIGIENKVGTATDQEQQISHYGDYLSKKYNSEISDSKFTLFYLTPEGNSPSEFSISKDNRIKLNNAGSLRDLSYSKHIIPLFELFELRCEADNVRAFIRDFNKHLKQRFRKEFQMTEMKIIKDYAKSHKAIFEHIDKLTQVTNEIKNEVTAAYFTGIINEFKSSPEFCEFQGNEEGNATSPREESNHTWIRFQKSSLTFRIGYSNKGVNRIGESNGGDHRIVITFFKGEEEASKNRRLELHYELEKLRSTNIYNQPTWITWHELGNGNSLENTDFMFSMLDPSTLNSEIEQAVDEIKEIVSDASEVWGRIMEHTGE